MLKIPFLFLATQILSAAPVALPLYLANSTCPAGGTAQLQIFLTTPQALIGGGASIDLDPAIFDNILAADVYSATGDQIGTATIQGRHLDLEFASQTGGIGRVPGLPVLSITVPILASAAPGATFPLALKPGAQQWLDIQGIQYLPVPTSGTFTVGGSLSIRNVGIAGGLLPAGSVVEIDGSGFSPTTTVQIDGVALSSINVAGPQQLTVTLGTPADLTFRRVAVQDASGSSVTFYPVLHGNYVQRPSGSALSGVQPIFPLQLYTAGEAGSFVASPGAIALQNPGLNTVHVIIESYSFSLPVPLVIQTPVTLPPGASYLELGSAVGGTATQRATLQVIPDAPLRMTVVSSNYFYAVSPEPVPPTAVSVYLHGSSQQAATVNLNGTLDAGTPATQILEVIGNGLATPFTASVSAESGSPWLSVSPASGTACLGPPPFASPCVAPGLVTLTADPSLLTVGSYRGTVTITPQGLNPTATVIPVIFNLYAHPTLIGDQTPIELKTSQSGPASYFVQITSSSDPLAFITTTSTQSGKNWLLVAPSQGQTPARLMVALNPATLGPLASDTGTVTVQGPFNSLIIPLSLSTFTQAPTAIQPSPASLQFSTQPVQTPLPAQRLNVSPIFTQFSVSVQTSNGGNWLSAVISNGPGVPGIMVTANPAGLTVGTYQGTVTVSSAVASVPAQIPVTLFVWSGTPPAVTADPASLYFSVAHGMGASQDVKVGTGSLPLPYGLSSSTSDGAGWLSASKAGLTLSVPQVTPDSITVAVDASRLPPGNYSGTVTVTAPADSTNSTSVPVALTVNPAPLPPPQAGVVPIVTAVLNAASQITGNLVPLETVAMLGQDIGPVIPNPSAVQVLFDGIPAPVLYASATQVNAIVPYTVYGTAATHIQIRYNGVLIEAGTYTVAASNPGVFTVASNGTGPAVVFNQDGSLNLPSNPAARGSIIQIYATGLGAGSLPLTVGIGGVNTQARSGLFPLTVVVPTATPVGTAVPLVLIAGPASSQPNVTIAVK